MGDLIPITRHEKYTTSKVKASLFYGIDSNLEENARSLYHFLMGVCTTTEDMKYIKWPTMDDAIEQILRSEWGKDLPMYAIKNAFSQLRKNRYLRHTYVREFDARVLELIEFIGEKARS